MATLLAHVLFFNLVVTPLLMFVYAFVEVFRGIVSLFTSKRELPKSRLLPAS